VIWNKDKYVLKRYKNIRQIDRQLVTNKQDLVQQRKRIKICVLDNEGFSRPGLGNLGYSDIDIREKFECIADFGAYNLVLCDVDGIGESIDDKKQGIAVAENIMKAFYPKTIVALYTGKELMNYDYVEIPNVTLIRKNTNASQLAEKLDEICSVFWNPIKTWRMLEKSFREMKLPNIEIAILEDIFIRAIENKTDMYDLKRKHWSKITSEKFNNAIDIGAYLVKILIMSAI